MNFPHMLVMRNSAGGMIWQAYSVQNDQERAILYKNATANGFMVEQRESGYTDETTPGWRETEEWQSCITGKLTGRALGQSQVREILKPIGATAHIGSADIMTGWCRVSACVG